MKKFLTTFLLASLLAPFFTGCSDENAIAEAVAELKVSMLTADLAMEDLEGTWNMYTMTSDVAVDFDQNGNTTFDLLEETDCFDPMYFTFDNVGNVTTRQSRLFFDAASGRFSCQTSKDYAAVYEITGNELQVTFTVNGNEYTETKTISRYSENGREFLKITLTETETDQAVYVSNDPGNTVVSDIKEIEIVYIKQ